MGLPQATSATVLDSPLFAGGGVVWGESRCLRPCEDGNFTEEETIRLARPGSAPRTVFRGRRGVADSGPNGFSSLLSYTASGARLDVLKTASAQEEFSSVNEDTLSAGRLGGSLRRIFRCEGESAGDSPLETVFTLMGDTLVYRPGPCRPAERRIVALDLGDGAREAIPESRPGRPAELEAEGRFVSYELTVRGFSREYVVYDRAARAEAYNIALPEERDILASDIQRDGKAVLLTREIAASDDACRGYRLTWYSIAEPIPHDLAVTPCRGSVAITGDRIVFTSATPNPRSLAVTDIAGQARQLAEFGVALFDTDIARVTYGVSNCAGGDDFFVQHFDGPVHRASPSLCPISITSRRLRAAAHNRVRLRLRCPRGCNGRISIRAADGRKLALRDFGLGRTDKTTVTLRLNRRGRLRLQRAGRLRVTIKAITFDRDTFRTRRTTHPAVLSRVR